MNDMESMRTFADQLWKYMVPKLKSMFSSNVSYFRAQVVSNPGGGKLEVERPLENGTLTLPCTNAMAGAQQGQQVVVLVFGSLSNAVVVADGKMDFPYLNLSGGTLTGSLTLDPTGNSAPVITFVNAEKTGVGASRTTLRKNASASADYGTQLTDYVWGDGSSGNQRSALVLLASAALSNRITLVDYPGDGSYTQYRLYGQHNKPTVADVSGLEARLTAIENRLSALDGQ